MPTQIAVFQQEQIQAIADAVTCGKSTKTLDVDLHLPDNFYVGELYRVISGENTIPDGMILRCRFASNMQGAWQRLYLLAFKHKDEWQLLNTQGVVWDEEEHGTPSLGWLVRRGLFSAN